MDQLKDDQQQEKIKTLEKDIAQLRKEKASQEQSLWQLITESKVF